jgi:sodium/potassium-transporting ATPase subunit alpha
LLRNRRLLLGIAVEIVGSWALLYWPPLQRLLGTGPVSCQSYALCWLGPRLLINLDTLRKRLVTTNPGGNRS